MNLTLGVDIFTTYCISPVLMQFVTGSNTVIENVSRHLGRNCGPSTPHLDETQVITHILQRSSIQEIIYVKHDGKIIC